MFKNYLKIAYRNIKKHKGYSLINVAGLAIGMACCILILLFVFDELSYDKFHENHDRIYRVTRKWLNEDGVVNLHLRHIAPSIGPLLENDFPEILHTVRTIRIERLLVGNNSVFFEEPRFFFAEEDVFKVFTFNMTAGDPETALQDPFTIVITEEMAEKFFGAEDPIGKSLIIQVPPQKADMKVMGVIKSLPHNSHFHADFLGSFKTYEAVVGEQEMQSWVSNNFATYLLMSENYDINRLKSQLDPFIDRHMSQGMSERTKLQLQPLTDIHLHSHLDSKIEANSDIMYVYVFSIIAFFVLLIAWPMAYLVMSRWLQNFAYRSGIGLGTFLLAGGLAWVIAFLTVSYRVIRASLEDPVKALKYEQGRQPCPNHNCLFKKIKSDLETWDLLLYD